MHKLLVQLHECIVSDRREYKSKGQALYWSPTAKEKKPFRRINVFVLRIRTILLDGSGGDWDGKDQRRCFLLLLVQGEVAADAQPG